VRSPTGPSLINALQRERRAAGPWRHAAFARPSGASNSHPQRMRALNMQEVPSTGDHPPSQSDRVNAAWQQLQLVLGFFSRVDTKLSVGLGINLGMLAMLATRIPKQEDLTVLVSMTGVLFLTPLTLSFWNLWWGYFPDVRGGSDSLIFFQRIDRLTESDFLRACETRTANAFERDVLSQCWRNSKILSSKFRSLKRSYLATSLAIAPWMALITLLPPPPR